jgi:hypothetical protein
MQVLRIKRAQDESELAFSRPLFTAPEPASD